MDSVDIKRKSGINAPDGDINAMRPRQNSRNFADTDISKLIFLYEGCFIVIQNSLKFIRKGPVNKMPVLVQVMA